MESNEYIRKNKHRIMKIDLLESNDENRKPNYIPSILYINYVDSDARSIFTLNLIIKKDIDRKTMKFINCK